MIILILNIKEVQDGGREGTAQSNFQNFVIIANLNENSFSLHVELNSWSSLLSGADSMLSWAPEGKAGHKSDTKFLISNENIVTGWRSLACKVCIVLKKRLFFKFDSGKEIIQIFQVGEH